MRSSSSASPRRVLFFGCYDSGPGYPRVRSLRAGFESAGVEVFELREDLLPTREARRRDLRRPLSWPKHALRLRSGSKRLESRLRGILAEHEFDAMVVPYPGWFSIKNARRVFDGPILLDLFLSIADTACRDRTIFRSDGFAFRALRRVDRSACELADRVLLDTPVHANRVADLLDLPTRRFDFVQIGDPEAPGVAPPLPSCNDELKVLYVGTGVPLHGVEHVLDACALSKGIALTFIGGTKEQRARARTLDITERVEEWVDRERLRDVFDANHVVFGIFGSSEKAASVIPYKVVHGLAHGRVVITAETDAVQTMLAPGVDCLTAPVADPEAIARALTCLRDGPRLGELVATRARERFDNFFAPAAIGSRLVANLASIDPLVWSGATTIRHVEPTSIETRTCATSPV
ncbi:MAG: glycosyltransferase family 4 protein [Planctomycetes bacterium]|nr:glycosyltransferase family 4 protein [Planctomycetota bacterium]MCB9920079.1 glycosyltransferase family 4 protein [Planctomycetota bacterium]